MMLIGTLSLTGVGIPHLGGFAGFHSKDAIIEASFAAHTPNNYAFWLLVVAAFMTAFYSWRLIFMTFHGTTRADHETYEHAHESPLVMLVVARRAWRSAPSWPASPSSTSSSARATRSSGARRSSRAPDNHILHAMHEVPGWVGWAPTLAMLARLRALPTSTTSPRRRCRRLTARVFRPIYLFLLNKWYFDELYDWLFVRPAFWLGRLLVEGRRRHHHRRAGPDGIADARAVDHGPRRQAADRLRLPLRLRHADRRGAASSPAFMFYGGAGADEHRLRPLLSLVTFLPLVGALIIAALNTDAKGNARWIALYDDARHVRRLDLHLGAASTRPTPASSSSRSRTGSAAPSDTRWASTASRCCSSSSPRS